MRGHSTRAPLCEQAAQAKLSVARSELEGIDIRQRELKALLYARLGDAVNLEDGPEQ